MTAISSRREPATAVGCAAPDAIRAADRRTPAMMTPYRGPPLTLGDAAAVNLRFMTWCKACGYRSEPDPGEQARRYGPQTPVPDWCERLVCSQYGSRDVDMVVTGQ